MGFFQCKNVLRLKNTVPDHQPTLPTSGLACMQHTVLSSFLCINNNLFISVDVQMQHGKAKDKGNTFAVLGDALLPILKKTSTIQFPPTWVLPLVLASKIVACPSNSLPHHHKRAAWHTGLFYRPRIHTEIQLNMASCRLGDERSPTRSARLFFCQPNSAAALHRRTLLLAPSGCISMSCMNARQTACPSDQRVLVGCLKPVTVRAHCCAASERRMILM